VIAGVGTLGLVWRRRYEPSRYLAALAVAATIAGWAVAQNPVFLHGLTIRQAAAGHDTLVAVVVAVLVGALLLFPSLALLFRLTLGGELRHGEQSSSESPRGFQRRKLAGGRLDARLAVAFLVAGIGFLTIANASWAHAIGVACFFGFILSGYRAALPADVLDA
jgi:cytochrome d ubiquinol oxidase subunit II